ncbi:hypothetical protein [Spiroplasma ixodetis]|nr:hypothetical protein [Spiroplasma ixodetis]
MCRFLKLSKSTYYFNLKKKFKIIFMMKLLLVLLKKIKKFMVLED